MKNIKLLVFVLLCSISFGYGQEIISYSSAANAACSGVVASDPNLTGVGVCRGPGIVAAGGGTYNSRNWTDSPSIDLNDYLEWTMTPNANYALNLVDMDIRYDRSPSGPTMVDLQVDTGAGFISVFTDAAVADAGENNDAIDLSSYTNITGTITFRLYAFNASNATAGTFDIEERIVTDKGIIINGTVSLICASTTTWETVTAVTAWDNGAPNSTTAAILDADYNTLTDGDLTACSLTINTGVSLNIGNSSFAEIEYNVINNGTVVISDEGSFVQINDSATYTHAGSGATQVNKLTASISAWYEYTYWSSPVQGELVGNTFAQTNINRRFIYNASNFSDATAEMNNDNTTAVGQDDIDDNGNDWEYAQSVDIMQPGVGYACTLSQAYFATLPPMATSGEFAHTFTGPLNNGVITTAIHRNRATDLDTNWNFIGNPYASAIDVDDFFTTNVYDATTNPSGAMEGVIYLWSHDTPPSNTTNGNSAINFTNSDYAVINFTGGTTAGGDSMTIPNRFIPSGQGFFIAMSDDYTASISATNADGETFESADAIFRNNMRVTGNNDQFFRASNNPPNDDNKLWINFESDNGAFSQLLIGYVPNATDGDDGMSYDAFKNISTGYSAFMYSTINGDTKKYGIQGKAVSSLDLNEEIPLGLYTTITEATLYTLSIAQHEGDFFENNTVYLEDLLMNTVHDLSNTDYTFTSATGEFNDRFKVVFTANTLSNNNFEILQNNLSIVEMQNDNVKFDYKGKETIKNIKIIDVLGRELYNFRGSESTEVFNLSNLSNAAYIAQVELSNGNIISKKAIKK